MATEHRLKRILAMVPWIVAHDGPSVAETCARFGCTAPELMRDIQLLYLCGLYPYTPDLLIEASVVDGRVYVEYADYFSRPLRLTPGEGLGLVAAAMLGALSVPAFGGSEFMSVAAAVSMLSLWMLAAGVWLLRGR